MRLNIPKYLRQIMIFSLLLSTLPVILLGVFSYETATSSTLNKITKSTQQLLSQTQLAVEQNLKLIDRSMEQFSSLPVILEATTKPLDSRQFQIIRDVNQYMDYTLKNGLGISELYFVNFQDSWAIYPDKIIPLSIQQKNGFMQINKQESSTISFSELDNVSDSPLSVLEIPPGILLLKNIPIGYRNPRGLIVARIKYSQLNEWIAKSENFVNLYILDGDAHLLASNNPQITLGDKEIQAQFSKLISTRKDINGFSQQTINGKKSFLFYQKSLYTGWTYVSIVPHELITKDSRAIGWVTMWVCVGVMMIMIILSYNSSKRIYYPVKHLFSFFSKDVSLVWQGMILAGVIVIFVYALQVAEVVFILGGILNIVSISSVIATALWYRA